ncbi:MAG: hypothetical protein NTX61_02760 [Bacteroidetes bacterium]|nr:hypothetical protein [Bacteroidota bacterium]
MKRFLLFICTLLISTFSIGQTTLISPTGDGGFETGGTFLANNWTVVNGAYNMYYVGATPIPYAGTNCAYTGSSASTWAGTGNTTYNHFYRDIVFPAGETAITLKFYYKINSTDAGYDQLKVFLVPTSTTPVAGVALASGQIGVTYETATTYTLITITIAASNAGTTKRLVFSWNTDAAANYAALAIDNIELISRAPVPANGAPTDFLPSLVTQTSMTVGWKDGSTNETAFRVYRSTDNITFTQVGADIPSTSTGTTGTSYSLAQSPLLPGVLYYYRIAAVTESESPYLLGSQSTLAAGTFVSVTSGNWSDNATWGTGVGVLPGIGDDVTVSATHTVTIAAAASCNSLIINGTLQYGGTAILNLTIANGVNITSTGVFTVNSAYTHTLYIGGSTATAPGTGSIIVDGTLDFYVSATIKANIYFYGIPNVTITGSGATCDFNTIYLNKGSVTASSTVTPPVLEFLRTFTVQGGNTVGLVTTHTAGTLKMGGSFTLSQPLYVTAAYTVPALGGLWLNNPTFTATAQAGATTITGLLKVSKGTLNAGTLATHTMGFSAGSTVIIEGGYVNASQRFGVAAAANAITYTQSGGTITVCTVGNTSTTLGSFDLGTSLTSTISMTGGTIVCQLANTAASGPRDFRNQAGTGILGVTGGTLQLGNASSGAAKAYTIGGVIPNLVITNTSGNHTAALNTTLVNFNNISLDITINAGNTLNLSNLVFLFYGNTLTNNGIFTHTGASSRFVWFRDGANQLYTGTGTVTAPMTSFETQNNGVTISPTSPNIVVTRIILFVGGITNANRLTLGNGGTTTGTVQIGNTTDPTNAGTFDVPMVFNLGTGGEVLSYLRTTSSKTTNGEINTARTVTSLTYDDNDVTHSLTLAGGNLAVSTTLALTNGIINTNSSNILTVSSTATAGITGGSATSYVKGPLIRTLPVSLVSGSTYTFPIGKSAYNLFELVNPTTGSGGTCTIQAEVFDADCAGIPGLNMTSLNTNHYWQTSLPTGGTNFTNTTIRLTEPAMGSGNGIGASTTLGGTYDLISSAAPSSNTILSNLITSLNYFAIGLKSVPMSYTSSTTTQPTTAIVSPGSTDQQIIAIQIVTAGNASPLYASSFTLNTNGCTTVADLTNAKLFYTGISPTFATTTPFGSPVTSFGATGSSWDITGSQVLAEGTNYFWLAYSIAPGATQTDYVDAECTSLTVSSAYTPTVTAPAGNRQVLQSVVIGTGTSYNRFPIDRYYNYSSWEAIYTQAELGITKIIRRIAFNKQAGSDLNALTPVTIYMQNTSSSTLASGTYSLTGYTSVYTGSFPNTATSGWMEVALTTPFTYNGTDNLQILILHGTQAYISTDLSPKWYYSVTPDTKEREAAQDASQPTSLTASSSRANVTFSYSDPPPMVYTSSTTTQTVTGTLAPSATNQQIIGVEVVMTNSFAPLTASSFTFNTNGCTSLSDLVNAKLYYTGTSSTFSATAQFGSDVTSFGLLGDPFNITGTQTLSAGTNYFWLTYDISPSATGGNFIDAECTSLTVGGSPYVPTITAPTGNRQISTDKYLSSLTITQASTANVTRGSNDNEILKLDFNVAGTTSTLPLNSITVTNVGADANIATGGVKLYQTATNVFSTGTPLGTAQSFSSGLAAFITLGLDLLPGHTYVWVTYDIAAGATPGATADAKIAANAINVVGTTYPATEQSPGGSRPIVCGITNTPYSDNFDSYTTPATGCITVTNNNADTYTWQTATGTAHTSPNSMSISYNWDGITAMDDWFFSQGLNLLSGHTYVVSFYYRVASSSWPENLEVKWGTAPNAAGMTGGTIWSQTSISTTTYTLGTCTTFSPGSSGVYYVGWHGFSAPDMDVLYVDDISVVDDQKTLTSATVTQGPVTQVAPTSLDNPILMIDYLVAGSSGTLNLNSITVTSANSDFTDADIAASGVKLYTTTGATFTSPTLLGTAQSFISNVATFGTLSYSLATGHNYVWVTYDIAGTAIAGHTVDAKILAGGMDVGGITHNATTDDPSGSRTISDARFISSISVSQASTANVTQASTDQEILMLDFNVGGTTGTLPLNSIVVTNIGADANIAAGGVKLYKTATAVFSTGTMLGTAQSFSAGTATFSSLGENLLAGNTYIWVAYDISGTATPGALADAKIAANAIDVAGTTYPSTEQSPGGSRTIVTTPVTLTYTENFETGSAPKMMLTAQTYSAISIDATAANASAFGLHFTGGSSATGWTGSYGSVTATNAWVDNVSHQASSMFYVNGTGHTNILLKFDLKQTYSSYGPDYSWFRVRVNGVQISDIDGTSNFNPTSISSDPFTTRTFNLDAYAGTTFSVELQSSCKYNTGYSSPGDNAFVDNLIVYEPVKTLTSATVTQASTANVLPNSSDNPILMIDYLVTGNIGVLNLNSIYVTSANSDVTDADITSSGVKLYRTSTALFSTANSLGTAQSFVSNTASFSAIGYDLPEGHTYVWVTYDIAATAVTGHTADAKILANNMDIGGSTYNSTTDDPAGNRLITDAKFLQSLTVSQASTANVIKGSTDQEILMLDFNVGGNTGTLPLNSIIVTNIGADANIAASGVILYRTTTTSFSTANMLGTAQSYTAGVATFSSLTYDLPNGHTYVWVAYNIASGATAYQTADAKIIANAIDVAGTTYPATEQSPAFSRTIIPSPYTLPFYEDAWATVPPTDWNKVGTTWSSSATSYAGGVSPELKFYYYNGVNGDKMITPPLNTTGLSSLSLHFKYLLDDYGVGCTLKVQSSTDGTTWTDEAWSRASIDNNNYGPFDVATTITNNVGSITYVAFVVTGSISQIDNWYIDNVLIAAPGSAPTVTTYDPTDLHAHSITGNGEVTSDGGASLTERGFVWGTSVDPTIDPPNHKVIEGGTAVSTFNASLTGMNAGVTYHVRAFATNAINTSYGVDKTFTTPKDINATVFLSGPYDITANSMTTILNDDGVIPTNQPYFGDPWYYTGSESVTTIPTGVVDWVLVELRDADLPENADASTIKWQGALFLKLDGTITGLDGVNPPEIGNPSVTNGLFVVVRQRNHIAVMSNVHMTLGGTGTYSFDFSDALTKAYGADAGYKQIDDSPIRYGMVAGDADADGSVFVSDFNAWAEDFGNGGLYDQNDIDMDDNVFVSDFNAWAEDFESAVPFGFIPTKPRFVSQVPGDRK